MKLITAGKPHAGKFVAYYRVSTQKQGASGLGLEAQQAAVKAYLNGGEWDLIAEFTEVESGTRKAAARRPQLAHARPLEARRCIPRARGGRQRPPRVVERMAHGGCDAQALTYGERNV